MFKKSYDKSMFVRLLSGTKDNQGMQRSLRYRSIVEILSLYPKKCKKCCQKKNKELKREYYLIYCQFDNSREKSMLALYSSASAPFAYSNFLNTIT